MPRAGLRSCETIVRAPPPGATLGRVLLAFKLVVTPLLIGGASLAARRWGPAVGGWLVALPLTSGPVAVFLALAHGPEFAASASAASLVGCVAIVSFCLAYARLADRGWRVALLGAYGGWLVTAIVLEPALDVPPIVLLVLAVVAGGLALRAAPGGTSLPSEVAPPAWDIPLRMGIVTVVVVGLTAAAPFLGASLSGLLAMVPVITTVLTPFAHERDGSASAVGLVRGILTGLFGTAAFLGALAMFLVPLGIGTAVVIGLACLLLAQGLALAAMRAGLLRPADERAALELALEGQAVEAE